MDTQDVLTVPTFIATEMKQEFPNKYHDIDCCERTRGVDSLLSRYKQDREEITSMMINDPESLIKNIWKQDGPLAIDNSCRCRMGKGDIRSQFSCAQCRNLGRLIDFRFGGVERPFRIECGNHTGKSLMVSKADVSSPFLKWDEEAEIRARNYFLQYRDLSMCGTPNISGMRCISGDSFTIRTLITWMISRYFAEMGLPHCPTLHTSFICRCTGYSLCDMPSIGTLSELHKIEKYHLNNKTCSPLESSVTRTIIVQLLVILLELSKVNFSHGTPSVNGLVFNKDPISYLYDNVHVNGPLTLQISDMWNSSATFGNVHYFPKNISSSMYIEQSMFVPNIATKTVKMAYCHNEPSNDAMCNTQSTTLYRLTNSTIDIYGAMRHIGFPLYVGSFDFYCFMVSLMCDKQFFDSVKQDAKLYSLWSMMWLIDDLGIIENSIKEVHSRISKCKDPIDSRISSSMTINIIRGAWLRCDIIKFMWSLIKAGW